MEDIHDIYDPIIRESSNLLPILLTLSVLCLIAFVIVLLRTNRKKKSLTNEELYENYMENYTKLGKKSSEISSYDFAYKVNSLLKGFFTDLLKEDYYHTTTEEFINTLENLKMPLVNETKDLMINYLQPALYGNIEISEDVKKRISVNCVELTTHLYNKKGAEDV